jgi:carboxymethylenebutenolidase
MSAAVNYLCSLPMVDRSRIAVSGYSQPANAALTLASSDPRVKAVVWNYGGSPWILPYNSHRLPPVLIFHGADDTVYSVKYAQELAANLFAANRYYQIYIYPGQEHLFTIYYDLLTENRYSRPVIQDSFEKLVSFLYLALQHAPLPNLFPKTNRQPMITTIPRSTSN